MTRIQDFLADRPMPEIYETYLSPGIFVPFAHALIGPGPVFGRLLDLACGTGVVSRMLARRLARGARIDALDVAPPMLDLADRLAAAEAVRGRMAFHQGSADALPFEDGTFDGAYCQQGLQFFPDKLKALKEVRRVLKPGSLLRASVWTDAQDGNDAFGAFETLAGRLLGEDLVPLGPFAFGDMGVLRDLFSSAGFTLRRLERVKKTVRLTDIETFVLFEMMFLGRPGPNGQLMPVVAPDDPQGDKVVDALVEHLSGILSHHLDADGILVTPMTAHVILAQA